MRRLGAGFVSVGVLLVALTVVAGGSARGGVATPSTPWVDPRCHLERVAPYNELVAGVHDVAITADGTRAYFRTILDAAGPHDPGYDVFERTIAAGEVRELTGETGFPPPYDFEVSADGSSMAYAQNVGNDIIELRVVDTGTLATTTVVDEGWVSTGGDGDGGFRLDDAGERLVYHGWDAPTPGADPVQGVWLYDLTTDEKTLVDALGSWFGSLAISGDGSLITYVRPTSGEPPEEGEEPTSELVTYEVATGDVEPVLVDGEPLPLEHLTQVVFGAAPDRMLVDLTGWRWSPPGPGEGSVQLVDLGAGTATPLDDAFAATGEIFDLTSDDDLDLVVWSTPRAHTEGGAIYRRSTAAGSETEVLATGMELQSFDASDDGRRVVFTTDVNLLGELPNSAGWLTYLLDCWTFADVGPDHPFAADIEWFAEQGITEGYDDRTFRPAAPVTR
ncbi:hypothetical protein B7486_56350, partial [cyanobacterium TDX16]